MVTSIPQAAAPSALYRWTRLSTHSDEKLTSGPISIADFSYGGQVLMTTDVITISLVAATRFMAPVAGSLPLPTE